MKNMQHFWDGALRQSDGETGAAPPEAPAVVEAPVVADAGQETAATGEALGNDESVTAESSAKPPQGLLDRIGQLTRQKRELEERAAARRAGLA